MANISVIMPLFNAEKYLPEALQSVLKQTYKNFELICIDDCSADRTRIIVEEFRKKDDRIRILVNEEHLGAGPSRNKGLKAAEGKFILFLDGDDIFEEELLEKVGGAMEKYRADLVLFEYLHVPSETIYTKKVRERPEGFAEKYCKRPFSMNDFEPREFLWWTASSCNRMFRRTFLEENKLEFQNLPSGNDVYFSRMSLFCAKRILCLDDRRVMVYARDHSEPFRISNNRDPMCTYYAMEKLAIELNKRNMFGRFAEFYFYVLAVVILNLVTKEKDEERKKKLYNFLHEEGIARCVEYQKEYYERADEYDRYLLESFQDNVYESRWFDNTDTYFQLHLKKKGDIICEFIKKKILEKKKIILWGVGVNGKILLGYLAIHSIKLSGIVDCDEAKQGEIINEYEISDPAAFAQKVDYIIVTSYQHCQEVSKVVENTNTVVVDLLSMLTGRKKDS